MAFTREQAYARLAAFHPAPIFLQSYQQQRLPENLEIYFGPPEEFFIAPASQARYIQGGLIPILDDGNFGIITFADPHLPNLVQLDIEAPDERLATFSNWQQFLAGLLLQIGESGLEDEELETIAKHVQFREVDLLFEFFDIIEATQADTEYEKLRHQFISAIQP